MNLRVGRLFGVVLIALGLTALRRARGFIAHAHPRAHDEEPHVHLHVPGAANARGHRSDQATNHGPVTADVSVWWRAATWVAAPLTPP